MMLLMGHQYQQREAVKQRDKGDAAREIARSYNVLDSTISRHST